MDAMKRSASLSCLFLVVASLLASGCGSSEADDASGEADDDFTAADITFKSVAFAVPTRKLDVNQYWVLGEEEGFRQFFAESCGTLCSKPFAGPLPMNLTDAPGKHRIAVYINEPKVPAGRQLVVRTIEQGSSKEWLRVTTCTRAGTRQSFALLAVEVRTNARQPTKVSADNEGTGLEPCP